MSVKQVQSIGIANSIPRASIIIPTYNEEKGIGEVLENLKTYSKNLEIIVVDDGSEDDTAAILKKFEFIKVVHHNNRKGYGAALKTGIRNAKGNIIAISDADGTYPNERIPELIATLLRDKCDMVVGARTGKVKIPAIRKPAKWFINRLANYLSNTNIPDLNSGMRVMKREAVEKFIHILPDGFSFTTTITLAMLTNNCTVEYVPIDYFSRKGKSKIRPVQDTLNFIQLVIRTVLYFKPLRVFIPLSLFLVLFAFFLLFSSWYVFGKPMDVSFGVTLIASVMVLSIGMLADLIDKRASLK